MPTSSDPDLMFLSLPHFIKYNLTKAFMFHCKSTILLNKSKCFSVQLDISILYSLYLNFYDIVITLSFD